MISLRAVDGQPVVKTKGDANEAADLREQRITSDVVPTVMGSIPQIGKVALEGGRTPIRIAIMVLIGFAVLLAAKRSLWRTG